MNDHREAIAENEAACSDWPGACQHTPAHDNGKWTPEPRRCAEKDARVFVVQWVIDPMPKEQWSVDRFWPYVEVYASYSDALSRWSELRDSGYPASVLLGDGTRLVPPATTEETP